jgi:hypothetical protein
MPFCDVFGQKNKNGVKAVSHAGHNEEMGEMTATRVYY